MLNLTLFMSIFLVFILGIIIGILSCRMAEKGHFCYRVGRPVRKEVKKMELSCTNEEKIHVTVQPVTAAGSNTVLDGPISVTVQSGEGTVELDADGKGFWLISGDNPGDTAYLVSGDADLGAGVQTISDVIILHVAGALAVNLGLVAEAPVPK